jgi:hypothetical protein
MDKKLLDEIKTISQKNINFNIEKLEKDFITEFKKKDSLFNVKTSIEVKKNQKDNQILKEQQIFLEKEKEKIEKNLNQIKNVQNKFEIKIGDSIILLDYNLLFDDIMEKRFFSELKKKIKVAKKEYSKTFLTENEKHKYLNSSNNDYLYNLKEDEVLSFLEKYSKERKLVDKTKQNKTKLMKKMKCLILYMEIYNKKPLF